MDRKLIGFCGKAGCGKDTAAWACQLDGFDRYAFADPVKDAVGALLKSIGEHVDWSDRAWKERPITFGFNGDELQVSPRELAQTLGTEWGRECVDDLFWIRLAQRRWDKTERLCIPDVRFDNEARWIESQGGKVIQIERDDAQPIADHVSEKGISPEYISAVIPNNGTRLQFEDSVRRLVRSWE